MKKISLLLLVHCLSIIVWACLNESSVNNKGNTILETTPFPKLYNKPDKQAALDFFEKFDPKNVTQYKADTQSDIAVHLVYMGQFQEALDILRRLQKDNPADYNIAANLGTTYELVEKNDSALYFIKKGIQLNPDSHNGSEWVHVKILEAKLKIAKDPSWLSKNKVLNTGLTTSTVYDKKNRDKIDHIKYQMYERVPFTPFADKILANVFNELGDAIAGQESMQFAYVAYGFSLQYDPSDPYNAKQKMEELIPQMKKHNIEIQSWKKYYYDRDRENQKNEVASTVIEKVTQDPENILKTGEAVSDLWDEWSGEKAKREKARQRRQRNMYITGGTAGAILLLSIGFVIYRNRRKKTSS